MLILLFVLDELSYDTYHPEADHIYRIVQKIERPDAEPHRTSGTPGPLATEATERVPEIRQSVRLFTRKSWLHHEDLQFEYAFCLSDPEIFTFFSLPLLQGDPEALRRPGTLFITETVARTFFPHTDPIGKTLTADYPYFQGTYTVAGILKDLPQNSDIRFECLTTTRTTASAKSLWQDWRINSS